jgi:hypothetical protein
MKNSPIIFTSIFCERSHHAVLHAPVPLVIEDTSIHVYDVRPCRGLGSSSTQGRSGGMKSGGLGERRRVPAAEDFRCAGRIPSYRVLNYKQVGAHMQQFSPYNRKHNVALAKKRPRLIDWRWSLPACFHCPVATHCCI